MAVATQFTLLHFIFLLAVCLLSFIIGARITSSIKYHSLSERFSVSTVLGLGIIGLFIYVLGLFKGLYGRILIPLLLVMVIIALITWPGGWKIKDRLSNLRELRGQIRIYHIILIILLAVIVVLTFKFPLYPPIYWDSIEYHLAAAKIFTQAHGLVFTEYLRLPVAPLLNHMLFAGAFIVYDEVSAQVMVYAMLIVTAIGIYALSRRYYSPWVGILSSALWLGSPFTVLYGSVGYIDIGLTLFSFIGIYCFINYYSLDDEKWLWLSGIILGFASAIKYPALFFVAICGLLSLWKAIKQRNYLIPIKLGLAVVLIVAPFYVRNYYYSGNPFFPYLSSIFNQRIWSSTDINILINGQNNVGLPKTIVNIFKVPWYFIYKPDTFITGMGERLLFSPLYFLAFIALIPMLFIRKTRWVSLFALTYFLFWFSTAQDLRYLLPAIPFLAIMASTTIHYIILGVINLLARFRLSHPATIFVQPTILTVLAIITLLPLKNFAQEMGAFWGPLPITQAEKDAFLQRFLPTYPAYRTLNNMAGSNYSLYAYQDPTMAFYTNGTFIGDWFGPARYSEVSAVLNNDVLLYQHLHQLGAEYFLVNVKASGQDPVALLTSPLFQTVEKSDNYLLFKLVAAP